MNFNVPANKALMIDGKIVNVPAGEFETADKLLAEALSKAEGVSEIKPKAKPKSAAKSKD